MKRAFLFLALIFLFIAFVSVPAWAGFVSVTTTEGFLYKPPEVNPDNIVIGMPPYYPLYVLAKNKTCTWYKVKDWMGTVAWIPAKDVTNKRRTVIVRKIRVNFRTGPGTRYRRICKLYKGYILEVLGKKGYWLKVKMVDPPKGTVGWVYRRLVWGY